VLGASDQDGAGYTPFASLSILFFQLLLSHLHVGIAEGALEVASDYARTATTPWATSGVDAAIKDPYILETLGELVARTAASDALVERATTAAMAAVERGWQLSDRERGELAIEIAAAKVDSTRTVLDVTTRAFELTGARATSSSRGFDRFWRNARTITLHDPVVYKAKEIGEWALAGTFPVPSRYS
jgi:alkylation response protein AidB-like acyl-CoA dehydrogenase